MIFGFSTDDGSLTSFGSQAEAISYAEGIDVEDGGWRFFTDEGAELRPIFTTPNDRGRFSVLSGVYVLAPSSDSGPGLIGLVSQIRSYEGIIKSQAELLSVLEARQRLGAAQPSVPADVFAAPSGGQGRG